MPVIDENGYIVKSEYDRIAEQRAEDDYLTEDDCNYDYLFWGDIEDNWGDEW